MPKSVSTTTAVLLERAQPEVHPPTRCTPTVDIVTARTEATANGMSSAARSRFPLCGQTQRLLSMNDGRIITDTTAKLAHATGMAAAHTNAANALTLRTVHTTDTAP